MTDSPPLAAFIGISRARDLAFPKSLRDKLAHSVSFYPEVVTYDNWKSHASGLLNVEFIFATWGMPKLNREFLETLPNLRAVFYAAGSVKGFTTPDAYERGIVICSAAAANAIPVAEYTTATTLLSLKRFWSYAHHTRTCHRWERDTAPVPVQGAFHSTVGLVSLGMVGTAVAQMLGRYNLDLLAYDPLLTQEDGDQVRTTMVSIEELFQRSDVVSIHAPLLKETENLVNGRLLRMMKRGATLINTSRGAIVNEADLVDVFDDRPDLTAILDVTSPEPPPKDSPLYQLDNIIVTPHIAGSMGNEITRMGDWMVEEFHRFIAHEPLQWAVTEEMLVTMA